MRVITVQPGAAASLRLDEVDEPPAGDGAVFGIANANCGHCKAASAALVCVDRDRLDSLINRRVPLERCAEALTRHPNDIKVVINFSG